MACKVKDPGGNVLTYYNGFYFVAKRHRDGSLYKPYIWVGITRDFFNMFHNAGSEIVEPTPELIDSLIKDKDSSMSPLEYKSLSENSKIKIIKGPDAGRITSFYKKVTHLGKDGFIVGSIFYPYQWVTVHFKE